MRQGLAARVTTAPLAWDPGRGRDVGLLLDGDLRQGPLGPVLAGAAGSSPYLAHLIARHAGWLAEIADQAPEASLEALIAGAHTDDPRALGASLRETKSRAALLIALCDLGGVWDLAKVTGALTRLADGLMAAALRALIGIELAQGRLPGLGPDDAGTWAGFVVIAMGKHGAGELNYSSDIDLICLFDQDRFAAADFAEARARMIAITRALIKLLSEVTADGYVFRTDLRLRPSPSTTPVCLALEAAERYYESVGRTWERAAHIKARAAAGDIAAGRRYLTALAPFVWRRSLDFAAIEDIHGLLLQIRAQRGQFSVAALPGQDIKLGPGGIREIEFFAQTRQLIGGGRDPSLRDPTTCGALAALAAAGWIDPTTAAALTQDYVAHRRLEHRIQMLEDAQTHAIPASAEGRARLAALSGWANPAAFEATIADRLARVHGTVESFFAPRGPARPRAAPASEAALADLGFQRPGDAWARIEAWRGAKIAATRSPRARELYGKLEHRLLAGLAAAGGPDAAIAAFDRFLSGLPSGVQVFSLFQANPHLLSLIIEICAAAPRLAAYLGRRPAALDALLSRDFFDPLPDLAALTTSLTAQLAAESDYERKLDQSRRWAREHWFRVGVQVLRGLSPPAEAGAAFSAIAEAVICALLPVVTDDFARRHGPPPGRGMAVIALGKLGSAEMTAGSDLDLITVYDAEGVETSSGPKPLPPATYYPRLTQALVAALSAPTAEGTLYAVDMRLRPSGRKGPVATPLSAFARYQAEAAWVWEHLALTRARVIAATPGAPLVASPPIPSRPPLRPGGPLAAADPTGGKGGARTQSAVPVARARPALVVVGKPGTPKSLAETVRQVIADTLAARAGDPRVRVDAAQMRARLIEAHRIDRTRPWALKHTAGGVMEIEFLAQTGLLLHGLGPMSAGAALGPLADRGWITADDCAVLTRALSLMQGLQQIERVALDGPIDPGDVAPGLAQALARAGGAVDFAALTDRLVAAQTGAAAIAARLLDIALD